MKAFCCACGRPVRQRLAGAKWVPGRCVLHPGARRYSLAFAHKAFAAIRAAIKAAPVAVYRRPARAVSVVERVPMPKVRELAGGVA